MIPYFHIDSIAKMLTARPDNGLTKSAKNLLTLLKWRDHLKYICQQK